MVIAAAAHVGGMTIHSTAPAEAAPTDYGAELTGADPRRVRTAARALLEEVTRAVRGLRLRTGLGDADVQDAIGETLLELVKRARRGHPVPGAVVQRVATAVCSRYVNGPVRHETAKALRILKERIAAEEARLGAALPPAAVARLAEAVRSGPDFDPRHRPVAGFHLVEGFSKPTSLDRFTADFLDIALARGGEGEAATGVAPAATACDRLLDAFDSGLVRKAELRERLWAAIAADEGLPPAEPGRVPRRVAADLRAYFAARPEALLDACRAQLEGRRTRGTVALLAPFAEAGGAESDEIARYLLARPVFAAGIWASALAEATARPGLVRGGLLAGGDAERRAQRAAA